MRVVNVNGKEKVLVGNARLSMIGKIVRVKGFEGLWKITSKNGNSYNLKKVGSEVGISTFDENLI